MKETVKRFVVLMGMLAAMLAAASPAALAESEPMLTGVLEATACTAEEGGSCPEYDYGLTDEASGTFYGILSDEDLSAYGGQRVDVFFDGTVAESDPPQVRATRVEPADGPPVGPEPVGPPPFVCGQEGDQYGPGGPVCPPGEVTVTGVLEDLGPNASGAPTYGITDEATGGAYVIEGAAPIGDHAGKRLSVEGTPHTGPDGLVFLDILSFEVLGGPGEVCLPYENPSDPASCSYPGPPPGEGTVTVTFELTIEGEVPEGKVLGVDTGIADIAHPVFCSTTTYASGLPRCEDGATYSDTFEWSAGSLSYEYTVFDQGYGGVVETFSADTRTFTEDATVSATYDVVPDGTRPPAPPMAEEGSATGKIERLGEEDTFCGASTHFVVDEETGRQVDLVSGIVDLDAYVGRRVTTYGELLASPAVVGAERCPDLDVTRIEPSGPVDPVDPAPVDPGVDVDGDGSMDDSDGEEAARISGSAADAPGGARVLPSTGGATLALFGAGTLLTAAGLLARRAIR